MPIYKGRKTYDTYAGGIDGVCVRAVLRKAGERCWNCASIDVRTAFLLAPRRGTGTLVVKPPKVLVACGLIPPTEMWEVNKALYGLQSSPQDWGVFRDGDLKTWSWTVKEVERLSSSPPRSQIFGASSRSSSLVMVK